jgi:AraC family transcriptional regulator, regulatory protein of adaptative response / methylated-DNA-[protein]-cysteine methyltransferase
MAASTMIESTRVSESDAWTAVATRDASYDGAFVYAVRTTGVYCRPSCSSRQPRRENVGFFSSADEAENAGFRACKRCRPRSSKVGSRSDIVERAIAYLEEHASERTTLDTVAAAVGSSPFHLQRTFKREVGVSPKAYQDAKRMERLKAQLRTGDTVTRATFEAGFGSSRAVYDKAPSGLGMTPAKYRRGGAGVRIRYGVAKSALGWVLVASTEKGVCAVSFGGSERDLEEDLRGEFPSAEIERESREMSGWLREILSFVNGERSDLSLPTDLSGTEFQLRVWKALQQIPYGATRTYREVAEQIGEPRSARAVARACATNRAALVVPCHRVVGQGGKLAGYRWGVERKRRLLERESAQG